MAPWQSEFDTVAPRFVRGPRRDIIELKHRQCLCHVFMMPITFRLTKGSDVGKRTFSLEIYHKYPVFPMPSDVLFQKSDMRFLIEGMRLFVQLRQLYVTEMFWIIDESDKFSPGNWLKPFRHYAINVIGCLTKGRSMVERTYNN